jgi:hypothetical protein
MVRRLKRDLRQLGVERFPRRLGRLAFIRLQQRLLSSPEAFARTLHAHARAVAKRGLERGRAAGALRQGDLLQRAGSNSAALREQQKQARLDLEHMEKRARAIDVERDTEPAAIAALYDVRMTRLSPVAWW